MEGFLRRVGVFERVQAEWQEKHSEVEGHSIVNQAFAQPIEGDLTEKVESLYTFRVPKLVEGACRFRLVLLFFVSDFPFSKATVLEEKPFNITTVTDLPYDVEILKNHPFTKRLHALNVVSTKFYSHHMLTNAHFPNITLDCKAITGRNRNGLAGDISPCYSVSPLSRISR